MRRDPEHVARIAKELSDIWAKVLSIAPAAVCREPDANVMDWIEASGCDLLDSMCFVDLLLSMEGRFGIEIVAGELTQLLEAELRLRHGAGSCCAPGQGLTNQGLWEWIAARLPQVSFRPVNIAGADCAAAGAFFGIRDLLERMGPDQKIAPSLPIQDELRGARLSRFWASVAFQVSEPLPQLHWPYRSFSSAITLAGLMISAIGLFCLPAGFVFLWLVKGGAGLVSVGWRLGAVCHLPAGITTFGDLARLVAASEAAAAPR